MSIWQQYTKRNISRRRVLAAAGAGSISAALLAACGGPSGQSSELSEVIYAPSDSSSQAKQGGAYHTIASNVLTWNPHESGSRNVIIASSAFYPKLLKSKMVKYPETTDDYSVPDLAQSFELSPDKLKLTMKLARGRKWDLKNPREIDAEDVVFSWKMLDSINPYRGNVSYNANPTMSITGITAIDANTITINLHHPDPDLIGEVLGPTLIVIVPREADMTASQGGFDPKMEVHGSGPWRLKSNQPDVSITWARSPDYYEKGLPYYDEIVQHILPDYSARLAQFRAGAIHSSVANLQDIIPFKRDLPQLRLTLGERYGLDSGTVIIFSYTGPDGVPTKWNDQRVRQAVALCIDRNEYRDYATNESMFEREGIDVAPKAQGLIAPGWGDHYLDPMNASEFGPNAKWYKQDIAEAKKLLAAAGYPNGFETNIYQGGDPVQVLLPQWALAGIKVNYQTVQTSIFNTISGAYNGGVNNGFGVYQGNMATRAVNYLSSAASTVAGTDLPFGRSFMGATPDGQHPELGDPELNSILKAYRLEFDKEKSKRLAWEYQRAASVKCYPRIPFWWSTLAHPGDSGTQTMSLTWPAVANFGAWRTTPGTYASLVYGGVSPGETMTKIYQDNTQAPFNKPA